MWGVKGTLCKGQAAVGQAHYKSIRRCGALLRWRGQGVRRGVGEKGEGEAEEEDGGSMTRAGRYCMAPEAHSRLKTC